MNKLAEKTNFAKGIHAEDLAANHLAAGGFEILVTRYKTKFGEIDIIAKRDNLLCFVEVKMRQTLNEALESITPRTRKRIAQSALVFLGAHAQFEKYDCRFDVITITAGFDLQHIENAWDLT